MGPNGQAMVTSVQDAHALLPYPHIQEAINFMGGKVNLRSAVKMNQMVNLDSYCEATSTRNTNKLRKLSLVRDPECKVRVIAILDYWSQCALKPLHDKVMY